MGVDYNYLKKICLVKYTVIFFYDFHAFFEFYSKTETREKRKYFPTLLTNSLNRAIMKERM